ncbi:unnamed protein product [Darwinula stevensoni]|uniref:Uncharacterized protein n=1 Tax=Darwinula stevensoni TaxID=69355 RepID=A0A7R9AFD8_9CRUS|nr:unnamed protein product [Darwinula stevensoni]CAG0902972.1 unnamed protein product [Darwinula stevensoni]
MINRKYIKLGEYGRGAPVRSGLIRAATFSSFRVSRALQRKPHMIFMRITSRICIMMPYSTPGASAANGGGAERSRQQNISQPSSSSPMEPIKQSQDIPESKLGRQVLLSKMKMMEMKMKPKPR